MVTVLVSVWLSVAAADTANFCYPIDTTFCYENFIRDFGECMGGPNHRDNPWYTGSDPVYVGIWTSYHSTSPDTLDCSTDVYGICPDIGLPPPIEKPGLCYVEYDEYPYPANQWCSYTWKYDCRQVNLIPGGTIDLRDFAYYQNHAFDTLPMP